MPYFLLYVRNERENERIGERMRQISEVTKLTYYDEDCVFFRNIMQSIKYIEWGARLVDLFVDGEHKLVFVFFKEDHDKLKLKWGKNYEERRESI